MAVANYADIIFSELVCSCSGIPSVVFLTNVDAYDPDLVGKDLTKTFHSKKLLELCKVIEAGLAWAIGIKPFSKLLLHLYLSACRCVQRIQLNTTKLTKPVCAILALGI